METAVFGGGCFWCTEAIFEDLKGISSVTPGYAGGSVPNPTYENVCSGQTGHAEVIRVKFDPEVISYRDLLNVFFGTHDPTELNRQGNDVGTQYRSVIFAATEKQKQEAENFIAAEKKNGLNVVTEVKPLTNFYPAEDYHRQFYMKNTSVPYCQLVINPKLRKLQEKYSALLKSSGANQELKAKE